MAHDGAAMGLEPFWRHSRLTDKTYRHAGRQTHLKTQICGMKPCQQIQASTMVALPGRECLGGSSIKLAHSTQEGTHTAPDETRENRPASFGGVGLMVSSHSTREAGSLQAPILPARSRAASRAW